MPYDVSTKTAGDEISSTYEGRHITMTESLLTHPSHTDGLVNKGDPVMVGENIVGVAFDSADAATDNIAIDTEGIWVMTVTAQDDDGNSTIARGDLLYINKTTCIISKNSNKQANQRFGYALSGLTGSATPGLVAVKIHWIPDDAEELVGTEAVPFTSTKASHKFREYRYKTSVASGDEQRGMYMSLELNGAQGVGGEAVRSRTILSAVLGGGVHGLHGGLEIASGGKITGLGVGVRSTFMALNGAHPGGSVAGGMSELWAQGNATNYADYTAHSIHRFVNGGDGTGAATAQNVFSFVGLSTTQNQAHNAWLASISRCLRVIVDGAIYFLPLSTAR